MAHDFINVKGLTKRIAQVEAELANLLHLKSFLGTPAKGKRGPKPKASKVSKVKKTRTTKGKRVGVGDKILKFLESKGKAGAHIKDIASQVGSKPNNVTAYVYTTGKKKGIKHVGPSTFAYTP